MTHERFEDLASKEFGNKRGSSFQELREKAIEKYTKMEPEELRSEKLNCELQLAEFEDDSKRPDNSVAEGALLISILSVVSTTVFSAVNNCNINIKQALSKSLVIELLIGWAFIVFVLVLAFNSNSRQKEKNRSNRKLLRFKLDCIKTVENKKRKYQNRTQSALK